MTRDKKKAFVAKVIDEFKVVINRGSEDGVKEGDKYQIYYLSDQDIVDPETEESLGKLEYLVGVGKVINVQEKMCTVESSEYFRNEGVTTVTRNKNSLFGNYVGEVEERRREPPRLKSFDDPKQGNLARLIY